MVNCSVLGCKSNTLRQIKNVSFHRFPKESTIFIHWVNATGRREWLPTKDCRICSEHFETECFRRTEHASYLKKGSIPKLNVKISNEPIFEKLCTCKYVQIRTTGTQTMNTTKSRSTQTMHSTKSSSTQTMTYNDDPDSAINGTSSSITRMRNVSVTHENEILEFGEEIKHSLSSRDLQCMTIIDYANSGGTLETVKDEHAAANEETTAKEESIDIDESIYFESIDNSMNIERRLLNELELISVKEETRDKEELIDIELGSQFRNIDNSTNKNHCLFKEVYTTNKRTPISAEEIKEETTAGEESIDFDERTHFGDIENSTNLGKFLFKETRSNNTSIQLTVKSELIAVKEDIIAENELIDIDENTHFVENSTNTENGLLKETQSSNDGDFYCDICNHKYRSKDGLVAHLRRHTREKSYNCKSCSKTFINAGQLNRHTRTHTGSKPYSCKSCNKTFSQSCNLKIHLQTHASEKSYACKTCYKTFSQAHQFKVHLRTHTGEKPYACETCSKSFSYPGELNRHMLIHTGDKPYAFTNCSITYSQAAHLKEHNYSNSHG